MRWLLLCALGACLSIPFATIAAVAVVKPVNWLTWVVIFILIVPLSVVAYFIHKTLSVIQKDADGTRTDYKDR